MFSKKLTLSKFPAPLPWKLMRISKNEYHFQLSVFCPLFKNISFNKIHDYAWPPFSGGLSVGRKEPTQEMTSFDV